jgi:hypothetical protein
MFFQAYIGSKTQHWCYSDDNLTGMPRNLLNPASEKICQDHNFDTTAVFSVLDMSREDMDRSWS